MVEAIRMPDLDLFMPGLFDLSFRCGGQEFEQRIVVAFPHSSGIAAPVSRLGYEKCNGCSALKLSISAEGQWLRW